jgi:hypothetical protein
MAGVCIDPGKCAADGDCGPGTVCDLQANTCVPGGCDVQEAKVENVPPNLLIVLDRSCSMKNKVGGMTKWQIAVAAISQMTTDFKDKIRFGLTLFPEVGDPAKTGDDCPMNGGILVPVGPGKEGEISTLLTNSLAVADPNYPDDPCVTNIDSAMQQATSEVALDDKDRDSYTLLLTDGKQAGCNLAGGDNGTTMLITELYQMRGVATFVLGFGGEVDPAQMNIFAEAGGVPNSGATKYYDAGDQASLDAALKSIAQKTLSCTYTLDSAPADPSQIFVFFNNETKVLQDTGHMNGWDYDMAANQVTFYGPSCDQLKSGTVTDIDIVFGCGQPTPD